MSWNVVKEEAKKKAYSGDRRVKVLLLWWTERDRQAARGLYMARKGERGYDAAKTDGQRLGASEDVAGDIYAIGWEE